MKLCELRRQLEHWRREGELLAGGLTQLAERATVYRHLFRASGGKHVFPLLAAHGALWARGYFRWALALGQKLSWQYALQPQLRRQRLAALDRFADCFRDINRRVCADTYANFHFTAAWGEHPDAGELVPVDLLEALNQVHAAQRAGRAFSTREKRAVFTAHFLYEQQHVVGPRLEEATQAFDWPLAKWIALRPLIRFAYFPGRRGLWFHDFSNRNERIDRGLQAFELAADVGFDRVEQALERYQILPERFFSEPVAHFQQLRSEMLASA